MRQRVITAVVALIIFIPILIAGGVWLEIAAAVLALVALSEVFIMRKRILVSIEFVVAALGLLVLVCRVRICPGCPITWIDSICSTCSWRRCYW